MNSTGYPIAEIFTSIQGEGIHTGTLMTFVRLAGCNVGKYPTSMNTHLRKLPGYQGTDFRPQQASFSPFQIVSNQAICTSHDGTEFWCDTDYRAKMKMTPAQILAEVKAPTMLITGGEPFLHDLKPLLGVATTASKATHIETSGTLPFGNIPDFCDWITCCPKAGFLWENMDAVNEFKFLVGERFDTKSVMAYQHRNDKQVPFFLQPINETETVNEAQLHRVIDIIQDHPEWRLSAQLHKFLGVR